MASALTPIDSKLTLPPRVLVVDDEQSLREVIEEAAHRGASCRVLTACSIAEARRIILTQSIQIMVADVNLPDGDGTSLLPILHRHQPTASAIIITGSPSISMAINAMREGALDFLPKPFSHQQMVDCLQAALSRQARADRQERRFDRLKIAVKRLNESRRLISRKVDLLCNDLVSAYGDLSRQFDEVRTQEGFRKAIDGAADLEQLLCHAMDWLLRQLGYCNVAAYLAADTGEFQLGAYMKYTLAGDPPLTDAIKRVLLPATVREGVLHDHSTKYQKQFTPPEYQLLRSHDLLGVNCTYLGESLAGLIFFRDDRSPFSEEDVNLVRSISPIFATALATVVREVRSDEPSEDSSPDGDIDNRRPPRRDPADWWKQGDESPY